MEIALVIALVASNGIWLFYWDRFNKRTEEERYTLLERIQRPERVPLTTTETFNEDIKIPEDIPDYAGVGQVNPPGFVGVNDGETT